MKVQEPSEEDYEVLARREALECHRIADELEVVVRLVEAGKEDEGLAELLRIKAEVEASLRGN
jgi:hypothetical protein